ncbi:MAG: 3-phosphoshikimate 1-carboxyvinyltransferase, partial [Chlamydiae bacterium]|nr:3-phosphoshikimate 1-carboxyvinyltransferase [Chlamydiota bacterium]
KIVVIGVGGSPHPADDVIYAGNSGIVLRFIGALCALNDTFSVITGDESIRHNRPIQPLIEGIRGLNGQAFSMNENEKAPLIIKGKISPRHTSLCGKDSQPVSALLIAASFLKGVSQITVKDPGEKPWIDLTLYWMDKLKIRYEARDYTHYTLYGHASYDGFHVKVPGDFSSAAFPMVAAAISGSELFIENLDSSDVQGDKKIISILQHLGVDLRWETPTLLKINKGSKIFGGRIDINDCIDALPVLATLGCFAKDKITIHNAHIARKKESDRISAITTELKKMGAIIEEFEDGLTITPSKLQGTSVYSHKDHRIAMSLAIAGLAAEGNTCVQDVECINKTYKDFSKHFETIGCRISEI